LGMGGEGGTWERELGRGGRGGERERERGRGMIATTIATTIK